MRRLRRAVIGLITAGASAMPATAHAGVRGSTECSTVLSVASIDVRETVHSYVGSPDDARGTRIQNRGVLAAPTGANGGVAPGQVGNFHVDGHRNSAGGPLFDLVKVRRGDRVTVRVRCPYLSDVIHTYTITSKPRYINFFTSAGRAKQIADTPFRVSVPAVQAYLTISTCATQEDATRGDRRRDQFGNPPGRWVVVAVLDDDERDDQFMRRRSDRGS